MGAIVAKKNPNKYTLKNTEQYSSRLDVTMEIHDATIVTDIADTTIVCTTALNVVLSAQVFKTNDISGEPMSYSTNLSVDAVTKNIIINLASSVVTNEKVRVVLFGLSY
jgi:hypothetical protein